MKYQTLFSGKNKEKGFKILPTENFSEFAKL